MLTLLLRPTKYWHAWKMFRQSSAARASARYFFGKLSSAIKCARYVCHRHSHMTLPMQLMS